MRFVRAFFALCLALCVALPFAGCTQHCTVRRAFPECRTDSPEGKLLTRELAWNRWNPTAALGFCVDSAAAAEQRLRARPDDAKAREDYNFAVARTFEIIRKAELQPWDAPVRLHGREGEWLLTFKNGNHAELDPRRQEIFPADRYAFRGTYVKTRTLKEGLGAPLVIVGTEQDTAQAARLANGKRVYYGMTGLMRFEGRKCVLTAEDPLDTERVPFGGRAVPLAADFTAPLALALAQEKLTLFSLRRQLRPERYADTARIARLQPYDASKIPVICVHGLLDSPTTWVPIIHTLRGDPAIRQRYQFWFYTYPSGYPYPHSAAIMRQHLDAIDTLYPGHKKAVLIGHSMGGLISRAMITDSGMKLWDACFDRPPEQVDLPEPARETLGKALIFRHRPEVGRVIFISTPHRGSDVAAGWMGKIGSRLVRAPWQLLGMTAENHSLNMLDAGTKKISFMPNSIETLSPDNPFVKAINTIPPAPGIPYHSIMGDRGKGGNKDDTKPVSTDGYVPYWSSHFAGSKSETIVPSKHSAHQNPEAIEKVRQILLENARQ